MCHSALEVTCIGKESGVWIGKLHEVQNKGFILTETDKPSTDKFPWSDSPSLVVHFWFDFMPGKKVFIIIMFSFLSFSFQYVLLVSSLLYVSCTETKGRYLFDNRGIFLVKRHSVCGIQYTQEESFLVLKLTFWKCIHHHMSPTSMWHLPLITQT